MATQEAIMNGADVILRTLADNGVEACFSNPGTSEMQLVAAFDHEPRVRPVLCLYEGVATGAADGYARMAGKPAATLLHLGAGLSNGSANLHNARRAYSPVVNLVGDHATYHRSLDAPLSSDIAALAGPVSVWVATAETAQDAVALTAEAVRQSKVGAGGPATLILPADCAWSEGGGDGPVLAAPVRSRPDPAHIAAIAKTLKAAKKPTILLGSRALTEEGLIAGGRLASAGVRVIIDTFVARQPRGAGRFAPQRMEYFGEKALASLQGVDLMVLASTKRPVAFFAYPGMPSVLVPEGCTVETLAMPEEDGEYALRALADAIAASESPKVVELKIIDSIPTGSLSPATVGASIARHMPDNAIVSEDAVTIRASHLCANLCGPRPRLALSHGGCHRSGNTRRNRRCDGAAATEGALSNRRWSGGLHGTGTLDSGPGEAGHHRRRLRQPCVPHLEYGIGPYPIGRCGPPSSQPPCPCRSDPGLGVDRLRVRDGRGALRDCGIVRLRFCAIDDGDGSELYRGGDRMTPRPHVKVLPTQRCPLRPEFV
jgi:acetolactate synthase I/II/III large subunit